ncbi:hypothetical protein V492_06172, partial [Pseudogymnoascus sp. VKM F-4246]
PLATVFSRAANAPEPIEPRLLLEMFAKESYILYFDRRSRHGFIALKSSATASTALRAWFCAMEYAHLDEETLAGGWEDTIRAWSYYSGPMGNVGTEATVLRWCVKKVERVWEDVERALKSEGWDVDVNALETRAGTRFEIVGGEEKRTWGWWMGSYEGKGWTQIKRVSERTEEKKGKDVSVSPNSLFAMFRGKTTHSETSSPFQSPTRDTHSEAATTSTSPAPTPTASEPASALPPSRSKLRLRKWIRSARGKDSKDGKDASIPSPKPVNTSIIPSPAVSEKGGDDSDMGIELRH